MVCNGERRDITPLSPSLKIHLFINPHTPTFPTTPTKRTSFRQIQGKKPFKLKPEIYAQPEMGSNSVYLSFSIKAVAVSTAIVSASVMLHLSAPTIVRVASSEVPKIYGSFVSWLTPPYLYFVINGIIISIAASSRFYKSGSEDVIGSEYEPESVRKQEFAVVAAPTSPVVQEEVVKEDYFPPMAEFVTAVQAKESDDREVGQVVMSKSNWTAPVSKETEVEKETEHSLLTDKATEVPTEYPVMTEKPPVSARLGRRKSLKSSPEAGKALGVARPKRNDTLESTWKAITDGRAVPLARHLKKSDTWETHHTRSSRENSPSSPDPALMRKCETFSDHGGPRRPATKSAFPPSRLRKEPSLGQDDLNRRVEAFIKKFNEEMKLQRQESAQQYLDMINRGSRW